jgi:uncharacterized protein (DUF885 family)
MTHSQPSPSASTLSAALRMIDDAWEELRRSVFVQTQMGLPLTGLPSLSPAEAERKSAVGRSLVQRIEALDIDELPGDVALSVRLVRFRASTWAREAEWYWTVSDPLGVGFFGMFLPTAYCGGFLLSFVHGQFATFRFGEAGDLDRYLGLIADYARLLDQMTERTRGQAERGMRMPKVQVAQARTLFETYRSGCARALGVDPKRFGGLPAEPFLRELHSRIGQAVEPAFDRLLATLSDSYLEHAPERVGLAQYAGGGEIYAHLVKLHTTLDLTPQQVHARGLERMAKIEASMRDIRAQLGFDGDGAAFVKHLNTDPRWRAGTVEGVTAVFQRYIDRLAPRFADYFPMVPAATYTIAPLPEALQGSMTFGYYDAPRPGRNQGIYLFNAANLTRQALFNVGALTYHELVPGHHLHLSTQQENQQLHPFRAHSFVNAYNEGWAEYAATFAGEVGMYEAPEERYGRLVMDAFLTCRLVVDTGMNILGWSLERARDYMRAHSGMAETEVLTETVRYSCDIPGQSLAYKLGDTEIMMLRERMRLALGPRFDIKEFHAAVLEPGALPMPELAWHIDREIERLSVRHRL